MLIAKLKYACILLFCLFSIACKNLEREGLTPGSNSPNFQFENINQDTLVQELKSFRGKYVLLNFWASWCTPCLKEMRDLETLQKSLAGESFTVLAVALDDTKEAVKEVVKTNQISFPVGIDNQNLVKNKYQITGFPETFILDNKGRIVLINDPQVGLVSRIKGERNWADPQFLTLIKNMIKDSKQ